MSFNVEWVGSTNFGRGRGNQKPLVHVFHIMAGTMAGTKSWFNNKASGVSSTYGIGKDGTIHQYVKTEDTAWANGRLNNKDFHWAKVYPGVNPNSYSISYELEGKSGDIPTEKQYQAMLWLVKEGVKKFNTPLKKEYFVGHFEIDPINKANCPGKGFPWERLLSDLGVTSGGSTIKPADDTKVITDTRVEFTKSDKILDGIIIDGVSYLQINKLRDIGVKVEWDSGKKTVVVDL